MQASKKHARHWLAGMAQAFLSVGGKEKVRMLSFQRDNMPFFGFN